MTKKKKGGLIYIATCKVDGRCYIGLTTRTLKTRKAEHIKAAMFDNSPLYFHGAIRNHGPKNFTWKVVARRKTLEGLANAEIKYIEKHAAFTEGFNSTPGGELG
ncbi:MAG: GIY-YIG nuclease family protein [Candidatus Brocadiales bacterium]|nr:GIY-YIG nuclease family protein [Candidatus Brocadiales bacterium]